LFLYQEESGFLFNSDSHFLFDFISKFHPRGKLLDIGCGCGILGLLCARDFKITLHSLDPQSHNIILTKENARVNHLSTTTYHDDFLSHHFKEKFDFIISNPPYYHDSVTKSKNTILHISRYNNHLPLKSMIQKVNQSITPRGHFIFCYDAKQLQEILTILRTYKLNVEDIRFLHGTEKKASSLVMIHARKGSNALMKVHPPLIHFQNGALSQEAENIYKKTRTYSIKCKIV
jgi:tRNA1(Val) A37 N6-methylase TrmN6